MYWIVHNKCRVGVLTGISSQITYSHSIIQNMSIMFSCSSPPRPTNLLEATISCSTTTDKFCLVLNLIHMCLDSFVHHNVLEIHPYYWLYQWLYFYCRVVYHCLNILWFVYPFFYWWTLRVFWGFLCYLIWWIELLRTHLYSSFYGLVSIYIGKIVRNEIAGL